MHKNVQTDNGLSVNGPLCTSHSSLWVTFLDSDKFLLVDVLLIEVCIAFYLSFHLDTLTIGSTCRYQTTGSACRFQTTGTTCRFQTINF